MRMRIWEIRKDICSRYLQPFLSVPTLAPAKVLVMATLIGQLPVWIGATLATWAVCWAIVSPEACQDSPACAKHLKTYPGILIRFRNSTLCKAIQWLYIIFDLKMPKQSEFKTRVFECVFTEKFALGYYHIVSTAALLAMAGHEVCGLIATYLGSQQTQALIPHLKSRCLYPGCKISGRQLSWHKSYVVICCYCFRAEANTCLFKVNKHKN